MLAYLFANPLLCLSLLILLPSAYLIISYINERPLIRRLGASAPQVPNYLPFSIDILIRSVRCSLADSDLDFWTWLFSHRTNPLSHTVEVDIGRQRLVFTAEPENIKAILATQFQDYGKGKTFHQDWKDFLGDGIFTTDGDLWHASRQLIRPQFVKERVKDLDIFETHVQKVISKLGGRGEEVDIAALFYRFTLDSATDFLLGESVGSLDSPQAKFAEAFNEVQRIQNAISRMGPFGKFVPKTAFWKGLKVIDNFVEPFIGRVLRMNIHDLKNMSNKSFLETLAVSGARDRQAIRDQVVNILLAGRDTTAGALSFLFLELSRRPEIFAKLRREVLETVGSRERPTYENLKNMQYLQHTMSEVLRLYPSVPFNVRWSLHDTTLPTGGGPDGLQPIGVLKDTPVGYSPLCMHRREDLYPEPTSLPHPQVFSPERWDSWQPKPWHYLPFNGGPRICIGQRFALTEMAYTVVRILQRFDRMESYTPDRGPKYRCDIVMAPCNGVKIGLWEGKR